VLPALLHAALSAAHFGDDAVLEAGVASAAGMLGAAIDVPVMPDDVPAERDAAAVLLRAALETVLSWCGGGRG
jgi:hypothetical protein